MFQPLSIEQREVFKILLALFHPPVIAGLVLGADEAIRPAATIGRHIKVASRFPDRFLDLSAATFGSLQGPYLARGIGEKAPQIDTIRATTGKVIRAAPVSRRLPRFR
jgi:hypothetical protein